MTIDTERLKTDAAYWPEWATHYSNISDQFLKLGEDGQWWRYDGVILVKHRVSHESCIPRPTKPAAPEWPEIGEHCETTWGEKQNWFECVVLPHDALALFKYGEWSIMKTHDYSNHEFRPIRTKEQRQREELIEIIAEHAYLRPESLTANLCVDAIINAGYRKQERD